MLDFVIIGGARCATTSLHNYLTCIPRIDLPSGQKETHYFAWPDICNKLNGPHDRDLLEKTVIRDYKVYLSQYKKTGNEIIRGEICPSYLSYASAAKNIYAANKNCKIICIVRDPIQRAFSHYKLMRQYGRETETTFENALLLEGDRKINGWEWSWWYIYNSLYGERLENYYSLFPRKNILIVKYEELINTDEKTLNKLLSFIGVEPNKGIHLPRANSTDIRKLVYHRWLSINSEIYRKIFKILKPSLIKADILLNNNKIGKVKIESEIYLNNELLLNLESKFQSDITKLSSMI